MTGKHEPLSMTERCRICLVDQGCMTKLQDECLEAKLKDLIKCTCIDIKYEENLPGLVCHVCLYKLNMWSEFKEQFIQSNKSLEQLDMSEETDNTIQDSSKDNSYTTKDTERKRRCSEDNNIEKKKTKMDMSSSEVTCDTSQLILDTICISDNDSSSKSKKNAKNDEEDAEGKIYSGPMRARLLPARRGKNIERRKASTKRWVERKKALLAAIGRNVSDTDSIASDEVQLSPVQKARAKNNADKETEKQKKIAKVLKSLETSLTDKYIICDKNVDSDSRRSTRSTLQQNNKNLLNQSNKKNTDEKNRSSLDNSMENPSPLLTNDFTLDKKKFETQDDDETFNSLKSELVLGDTTFSITLSVVDDQVNCSNSMKDPKSGSLEESQEKNTDIFDAVQLRRVNPVITKNQNNSKSNKFIERCLNIEVEGSELSVLKRMQCELEDFIQTEMKQKLFDKSNDVTKTDSVQIEPTIFFQDKLGQKLKDIMVKSVKNNIVPEDNINDASASLSFTKISPESATLPKYQPKVIIKRLNIAKESKYYKINNAHALNPRSSKSKHASPFITRNKRPSIIPVRYGDYASLDSYYSDSDSDDVTIENEWSPSKTTNSKTSKNTTTKQIIIGKPVEKKQNEQKIASEKTIKTENITVENHICGVCGLTFSSRTEVEVHVRSHKLTPGTNVVQVTLQNNDTAPKPQKPQQTKQKMMRCKRCHEIVEARFVKMHVCKTLHNKCYICNSGFRSKNLFLKHLENHEHNKKFKLNVIENKKLNNADTLQKMASASPQKYQDQTQRSETITKSQITINEKNDIQSDKITSTGLKLDSSVNTVRKPKEYTCFVCDKIFTDEEILKDHLQKHCDDVSEGEQNSKEQYQCAICGNILESDQALEEHVNKHLFDYSDDNPNLISMNQDNQNNSKLKEIGLYQCSQCSETFDSEILLEMHMQAHEEEIAIVEWGQQGIKKIYQYQCMLCNELFDMEKELAEHLDLHNSNAHVCQLCDRPFRTLEGLQEHVETHWTH